MEEEEEKEREKERQKENRERTPPKRNPAPTVARGPRGCCKPS
jgi:hypothetical protein